jgi:hypothetical protein
VRKLSLSSLFSEQLKGIQMYRKLPFLPLFFRTTNSCPQIGHLFITGPTNFIQLRFSLHF